jgi:hypothetical protein
MPRKFEALLLFASLSAVTIPMALAGKQALSGKMRWLAVASTQDLDTAKGIASVYGWKGAKVMSSESGWYAVVLGPFDSGSVEALRKTNIELPDLPKDALMSRGDNYLDVVYETQPSDQTNPLSTYDKDKPAHFSMGALAVDVVMSGDEDNPGATEITGTENGKQVFAFKTPADFSEVESNAGVLRLDPDTEQPQLVVTRYTGGAHCCTANWIITKPKDAAAWSMIDAGTIDGGGGYGYGDLDGDGALEALGVDNSFLYAFDSYAGSVAPLRIYQLRGASFKDVTMEPKFKAQAKQDLAAIEFGAKLADDTWHSNGFLAGWVAKKIQMGEGDEAWARMLKNYEKQSDFGPQICLTGAKTEECPADQLQTVPFPKALAQFLNEKDYGPLPKAAHKELQ